MCIVLYASGEVETMTFDKILLLKKNAITGLFGYQYIVLSLQIKPWEISKNPEKLLANISLGVLC